MARAPASPAQGLHHHGRRRYFNFSFSCMICGLENFGLADKKLLERGLSALLPRMLTVGRQQQSIRSRLLSIWNKEV